MQNSLVVLSVVILTLLAGCGSKPVQPDAAATTETPSNTDAAADSAAAGVGDTGEGIEVPGPQEGLLAKRVIYFDFDSSEIRGEGAEIVSAHAKHITSTAGQRIRLEGHTDERGSREYNIGLGERRAQAVRRALMLQGASDNQLSTVSYGEERPAAAGSEESTWGQNRRVEIVYLQ
jgi:peptidoglycan-associated lipoprotein